MGIGASIGLIAVGAILEFALPNRVGPIQIGTIGVILMVVGALGLAVTAMIFGPRGARPVESDGEIVEERRLVGRRRPW